MCCKRRNCRGKIHVDSHLESVGVKDILLFDVRSSDIFREMVIMLPDLLKEKLINNIKKARMYALLTEEVTDISNMQQLLMFVKYHNIDTGEPETKFLHTADLLSDRIGGNTCRCKINLKG